MNLKCFIQLFFIIVGYKTANANPEPEIRTADLVTQTVYGFLDFTTTIGKTVMIFSPQSAPSLDISALLPNKVDIIKTKPLAVQEKPPGIHPTKLSTNNNQNKKSTSQDTEIARKDFSSQPDYDLLSRQPETYAEESYHVVDLVSKKRNGLRKTATSKDPHPVGLVTTLSGKVAMDGTTTIHETSVIGTYISGKYAQVLQSSSRVLNNNNNHITPTQTQRVLRTESPTSRHFNGQVMKYKTRTSFDENRIVSSTSESSVQNSIRKHGSSGKHKPKGHQKNKGTKSPRSSHRQSEYVSTSTSSYDARRSPFRHRPQPAASVTSSITPANTKLRSAVSAVTSSVVETSKQTSSVKVDKIANSIPASDETTSMMLYPVETLNIDIITPSNFEDVYYEVATIKTPYTFQIGTIKKTRYVTVTSTTEKSLETDYIDKSTIKGPLIENILATTTQINQLLQGSSITTFPACTLADISETPSLDNYVETFTQSQLKLKTQVFPIVNADKSTSFLTFLQTYDITTVITSTKTTPVCLENNNLYEFNSKLDESGSEIHLDLEFADFANGDQDDGNSSLAAVASSVRPPVLNEELVKKPTIPEPSQSFYPQFSPEQLQQLAYLKLIQQNAQVPLIAPTQETVPMESLYESHVIPIVQGQQTSYRTISKLVSRTAEVPTPQPQPFASLNPFGLQQQPQFKLVTSATVLPTVLTQTLSRILKLTFGAKTALTTIFSTNVVSTDIPTFITTSLPVAPTASFGGFFPPAFPQFPFIG
ncbi:uncharacterized protein LOC129950348 isoform X2 [Eupeodes corollae]|uniref:uncharacterized protein LOC129950348 isoform X2 n=1 Tax=Eupeodes corollae TaxID=290404 RepID=UPI00249201FD|nr:uncharacterized protein LOC129950348 isoform X2 [Eupeodes corollae]